jgi:hypothetical protein
MIGDKYSDAFIMLIFNFFDMIGKFTGEKLISISICKINIALFLRFFCVVYFCF